MTLKLLQIESTGNEGSTPEHELKYIKRMSLRGFKIFEV